MAHKYQRGKYRPRNPGKYKGNYHNIVFRSSWELKMFIKLDTSSNVLAWNSEEVIIPYFYPVDQKMHRYFMDIWYRARDPNGNIIERLIEIKPASKKIPPKPQKRKTQRYIREVTEYIKNQAKWTAADKYAQQHNMVFQIFTEKELGIH